jgi:hypothetical protein
MVLEVTFARLSRKLKIELDGIAFRGTFSRRS